MITAHAPTVRLNGIRPEDQARYERLQAALTKATTDERRDALLADIQKLRET
jgi:hypothetical protein